MSEIELPPEAFHAFLGEQSRIDAVNISNNTRRTLLLLGAHVVFSGAFLFWWANTFDMEGDAGVVAVVMACFALGMLVRIGLTHGETVTRNEY